MEKLIKIGFCTFFHSNSCENIVSLVVAKGVAKEKNVLDHGQTNNIFTKVTKKNV